MMCNRSAHTQKDYNASQPFIDITWYIVALLYMKQVVHHSAITKFPSVAHHMILIP